MRVVSGSARGRRLQAPAGRGLRPTTDRVREAAFSSLASHGGVEEARVLDLFAGTGAMGIEALSRGASGATFVESDHAALAAIKANLTVTGLADQAAVVRGDVLRLLAGGLDGPFEIAFADPPYRFDSWPVLLELLTGVLSGPGTGRPGLAVLEASRPVDPGPEWMTLRTLRHGSTVVTFVRPH